MWDRDWDETASPTDEHAMRARWRETTGCGRRGAPLPLRRAFPLMDVRLSRHRKPEHTFEWDRTDRDLHNPIAIS